MISCWNATPRHSDRFALPFVKESLALPPEFDSFCVRHSPANEQVVNEEFPGRGRALPTKIIGSNKYPLVI